MCVFMYVLHLKALSSILTYTCTLKHVYTLTHIHAYAHMHTHTHTHAYTHTCTHMWTHGHIQPNSWGDIERKVWFRPTDLWVCYALILRCFLSRIFIHICHASFMRSTTHAYVLRLTHVSALILRRYISYAFIRIGHDLFVYAIPHSCAPWRTHVCYDSLMCLLWSWDVIFHIYLFV